MQSAAPWSALLSASHLAWILLYVTAVHADGSGLRASGRHSDPLGALVRCRAALAQIDTVPADRRAALMAQACSDLYVEAGCRDALRSFDSIEPAQRAVTLARRCREAYCPLLPKPRPALCDLDLSQVLPTALLQHFASFSSAVLAFDLGPAALALNIVQSALAIPPAIPVDAPAPPSAPSEVTLSARSIGGRFTVELRGAHGTQSFRLTPPLTAAKLAPLVAAARQLPPGTRAVLMADQRLPYGAVISLMDALRSAGLTRFSFTVDTNNPP